MKMNTHLAPALLLLLLIASPAASGQSSLLPIALPGCEDRCGDVSIPYPFGIGPNCSFSSSYNVICNSTYNPPKPFLPTLSWNYTFYGLNRAVQIMRIDTTPISLPSSTIPLLTLVIYGSTSGFTGRPLATNRSELIEFKNLDMRGTPFLLMPMLNTLVVVGCGGGAGIGNSRNEIVIGCTTVCPDNTTSAPTNSSCIGIGCCQTSVPTSLDYFDLKFRSVQSNNSSSNLEFLSVVNTSDLANLSTNFSWRDSPNFSTILEWRLPILPRNVPNDSNAMCRYDAIQASYYCYCKNEYFQGNPYLPQGCQVNEECEKCPDDCVLLDSGNKKYGCPAINRDAYDKKSWVPIALGLGISVGSISLSVILYGCFRLIKGRKEARRKKRNFKKNGGLLLRQQMFAGEGAFERTKLFTCDELERATDNFNENRILGRGGQGTVYKGMLLDGTIVAVKKSKKVDDESQLGQFINEVVILSQVLHRNVVKLFGCCLETEVPLLVYEFVPNGTLFQHLHNPREDFPITWKMRLKIAVELAEALTYLHSSSSMPIYHRDIKTSNILLDDRYRAKVSDFGISRAVSVDQTHLTTCIKGTFGYIDPEYFQSNQFTEKSDVYSFGIVLLELVTSKNPVHVDESYESGSLASEFLLCMKQRRLCDIVDADVLKVARLEELEGVADLVKRCLNLNGNKRPTMKAVAMTLQMLNSQNGNVSHPSLEQIVLEIDQACLSPLNISPSATNSDDSSLYTQPLLSDTEC